MLKLIIASIIAFCSCDKDQNDISPNGLQSGLGGYSIIDSVHCEGTYPMHLQGTTKDENSIFWSFTNQLVKTDLTGKFLKKVDVPYHHGDLTYKQGKIYVAVGFGTWNNIKGIADSWVYEYDANSLDLTNKYKVPELIYGAGGLVSVNNKFYVIGGLPPEIFENYIYEYDTNFKFIKRYVLETGYTELGIQTIEYHAGKFWLGCYGNARLIQLDTDFKVISKKTFDASFGMMSKSNTEIWVASNSGSDDAGYQAKAFLYKQTN